MNPVLVVTLLIHYGSKEKLSSLFPIDISKALETSV